MATNAYDYEEVVHFNPEAPTKYYGWLIMTSSSELKVAHFKTPATRRNLEAEVKALIPEGRADILAACTLIMTIDGGDDSDFARDMAMDEMAGLFNDDIKDEKWEELRALGDKYSTIEP